MDSETKQPRGVWQVYNGEIASLRREGYTLQGIGNRVGVTRERIRQILEKHYGKIEIPLLVECKVAEVIGCTSRQLRKLRRLGIIQPKRQGHNFRYSRDDIEAAMLALQRKCKHCGKEMPLKGANYIYCLECSKENRRYSYHFQSEEGRVKFKEQVRSWVERHYERNREMQRKAQQKYWEKRRREHYVATEYLVVKGNTLPIGSVFKAVGCKNSHLILKNGLTIPLIWVRKVK